MKRKTVSKRGNFDIDKDNKKSSFRGFLEKTKN